MVVWKRIRLSTLLALSTSVPVVGPAPATGQQVTTVVTSQPLVSYGRLGGVTADRFGNVFVANFHGTVWRVAPDGAVTAMAQSLQGSSGNAVDRAGNLYQASFVDGRLVRIARDGSETVLVPGGLEGPVGLIVADDGTVYVCACRGNAVVRVSPKGLVSTFAQHPDLDCPNAITRGPDGAYYVVSYNNGLVVRVDGTGRASRFASVPDGRNAHIAFARGAFWVTKIESNYLYRLGLDGRAERYAGTGALGFEDGSRLESPLARPNGIAVTPDSDAVIVNTLDGPWKGEEETRMVLRRIELPGPPAEPESISLRVDDLEFDALAAGPPDGDLVLLLHGFPQTGYAFTAQLRALAAAGYRAVAPDQRGYSPRARPRAREEYVMGNFVADVVGMADALGYERFHLVGHDWGGAVAWVTATRFPKRVKTLTVLSTPHYAALSAQRGQPRSDQSQRSSYFARFAEPGAEEWFLANDMAVFRQVIAGVPEEHQRVYVSRLGNPEAMRAALAWYHVFATPPASGSAAPPSGGSPPAVTPVRVPTLYVWGTEDGAFGREAAEMTGDFVEGPYDFQVLEGIGHWIPELAPDTVNELLLRHLGRARTPGS